MVWPPLQNQPLVLLYTFSRLAFNGNLVNDLTRLPSKHSGSSRKLNSQDCADFLWQRIVTKLYAADVSMGFASPVANRALAEEHHQQLSVGPPSCKSDAS